MRGTFFLFIFFGRISPFPFAQRPELDIVGELHPWCRKVDGPCDRLGLAIGVGAESEEGEYTPFPHSVEETAPAHLHVERDVAAEIKWVPPARAEEVLGATSRQLQ